jgi:hypothetical protein
MTNKNMEQLVLREDAWRAAVKGRSLVMEADVDVDEALKGLADLGRRFFFQEDRKMRQWVLKRLQAHLLLGLVAAGTTKYENGTLWPHIEELFGRQLSQGNRDDLIESWSHGIKRFELTHFETPLRFVGEVLLHGGVPLQNIPAFVATSTHLDGLHPDMSARQFIHKISMHSDVDAYAQFGIGRHSYRFLTETGEIAEDFVSRVLQLNDIISDDPETADTCGLPMHVFDQIRSAVLENPNRRRGTVRGATKRRLNQNPVVTFDERAGVRLVLPPLEMVDRLPVDWRIDTQGETAEMPAFPPAPGEAPHEHSWPVTQPTRLASVTAHPTGQSWAIPIVQPDDPLLVFDSITRALVRPDARLPKGRVWVGYPLGDDVNPIDEELEFDGAVSVVSDEVTPYGWDAWAFRQVDLTNVTRFRLSTTARADLKIPGEGRWRTVSTVARPRLVNLSPISFTVVPGAVNVTSRVPRVWIPGSAAPVEDGADTNAQITAGTGPRWTITVTNMTDSGEPVRRVVETLAHEEEYDLWPISGDACGVFEVRVDGPLGRGFVERVAVIEGLSAEASPEFRRLTNDGRGLADARVTLTLLRPDEDRSESVVLMATQDEVDVAEISELTRLGLRVSVPHMSVTRFVGAQPSTSLTPAIVEVEGLSKTRLRVNGNFGNGYCRLKAMRGGSEIQDVIEAGRGEGQITFSLGELVDTLASDPTCDLFVEFDHEHFLVGKIQPKKLARSVSIDDAGRLSVASPAPIPGLVAAVYPRFAPWITPMIVSLDNSLASEPLPEALRFCTQAVVVLAVDNPWAPIVWPATPDVWSENAFVVDAAPLPNSGDLHEPISIWLSGGGELLEGADLQRLLFVYPLLASGALELDRPADALKSEILGRISESPQGFLEAANLTTINRHHLLEMFVASGLSASLNARNATASTLWDRQPLIALSTMAGLSDSAFTYFAKMREALGEVSTRVMNGDDPSATIGKFSTPDVNRLDEMTTEALDAVMKAVSPIPGHLLDGDERMLHARELFDHRHDSALAPLCSSSEKVLRLAEACVTDHLGQDGAAPIRARQSIPGWYSLPALTIALALVDRLAARGNSVARALSDTTRPHFSYLARVAPRMIEQDLAIAELRIAGWEEANDTD